MQTIKTFIQPSYESNIPKFFVYRGLYNFMLFLPVWVIFLQQKHGLSLTQVTLLDSAFWLTMVLTEIPTGAVADTLGRKQSQVIGMILATGSILLFGFAPNYPLLILANSIWAFAITFISGADLAFFYDTLKELGREDEYPEYRGRLSAMVMATIAISSLLGGLLGEFNLAATFWITAALMVVGLVFLLWLKEPPLETNPQTGQKIGYRQIVKIAFETLKENIGLRYALLYSSLLLLMPAAIRVTFIQPYTVTIGLPIATLGVIALVIRLFQVAGAAYAGKIVQRVGEWRLFVFAPIAIFLGLLSIGVITNWVGIGIFAVSGFFSAAVIPTTENVINRQTPRTVRATILSVDSMLFRLLAALLAPAVGLVADAHGLPTAFTGMAVIFGFVMALILFFWGRFNR